MTTPFCNNDEIKSGPWSYEEDMKLVSFILENGHKTWITLPKLAGLSRSGKSCRLRWVNYLSPDVKRGNFSEEEKNKIMDLHELLGNKWSKIASQLPGRTDNEIKNVWGTYLKRKASNRYKTNTNAHGDTNTSSSSSSSIGFPRSYTPGRQSKGSESTTEGSSSATNINGSSLDLSLCENIGSSSNSVETMSSENFQPDLLEVPCFPVCPNNKSFAILKEIEEGPLSLVGPEDIDSSTLIERLDLKEMVAPTPSLGNEVPFFPVDTNFENFLDLIENEISEFKENGEHNLSIDNNVLSSSVDTKFKNNSKQIEIPNFGEDLEPNLAAGNDVPFSLVGPNVTSSYSQIETPTHWHNVQPVLEEVPISFIDSDNVKFSNSEEMVDYGESTQSGLVHSNGVPSYFINSNVTDSSNSVQMLNYGENLHQGLMPQNGAQFKSINSNVSNGAPNGHLFSHNQMVNYGPNQMINYEGSIVNSRRDAQSSLVPLSHSWMMNYEENVQPRLLPQNQVLFYPTNPNLVNSPYPIQMPNLGENNNVDDRSN